MVKSVILFLLLVTTIPIAAQEETSLPPAAFITRIPFKMLSGGIITCKARINNFKDSLNFIFDTGSGGISLDSMTALRLGLKVTATEKTIRGIAGIRKVSFAYDNHLHLPGLSIDSMDFHINDYDLLTSVYGEKIDGIIGYSFLSKFIVQVNYDSMKMTIYSKGSFNYPRGGYIIKPTITTIPIVNAMMKEENEVTTRYYFDTGAGMCILFSKSFIEDSVMMRPKQKWYPSLAEGLGGKAPMKQGVVKQVKIGPYRFKNVPAYIFEDSFNITSYPFLGGLLGNDLLRRFNLIINYEKRDLHIIPNSHFKDEFDYSYTGLNIYLTDGVIKVGDVMKGSPAEKAGFKADDIIGAIENNFLQNIQIYKLMLQNPGTRMKVLVYRKGEPFVLTLKVIDLMN